MTIWGDDRLTGPWPPWSICCVCDEEILPYEKSHTFEDGYQCHAECLVDADRDR